MLHTVSIVSGAMSLCLMCAIYAVTVAAPPESRMGGPVALSVLLAALTGLFPLALASATAGLWGAFADGVSVGAAASAGLDLASLAALVATILVGRATVRAGNRAAARDSAAPLNKAA